MQFSVGPGPRSGRRRSRRRPTAVRSRKPRRFKIRPPHIAMPKCKRSEPGLWRRHQRRLSIATAAVAVIVVITTIVVLTVPGSGHNSQSAMPSVTTVIAVRPSVSPSIAEPPTLGPAPQNAQCPSATDGPITTGRDRGGFQGGPAVIKAFDYAYYVDRSGRSARAVVAAGARVGTAEDLQAAIDKLDPKTTHCLRITNRGNGLWGVQLTQIPPIGAPTVIAQQIQTSDAGGRTWIVSIVRDPQAR